MKRIAILSLSILSGSLVAGPAGARAQPAPSPADPLVPPRSLGKPLVWKPFVGGYFGLDRSGDENLSGGGALVGVYKDLMPSIVGIGASGEAYLGGYSGLAGVNGGVRALAELRSLLLKVGVDYDLQREDASFILSLTVPLRRGGILGHGTQLRVDWLPGRGNSWNFGLQVPLEPNMGKTRFRDTEVDMPRAKAPARPPVDPAVAAAMREAHASARAIAVLSSAFWPDERTDRQKSLAQSRERILEFQAADRPGERPAPAGRPHGDRGPHPPRPGRPGVRPRHGSDRGGGGARRRPAGRTRARGRPRRGAVPVQPPPRAVQAAGGALGPRREGEGALRGQARRRRRPRRASRRRPRRLRRVPLGRRGDARLVGEAAEDGLAPRLAAVSARAPARAARHPGRARRDPREGPGHAPRRRQRRALPARPAVPGRAAAHDPRRRGLPRPLAARLRRRRPRGRSRRDRVLHQRRGLPRGADEAGERLRPDGEAPHLHDPRRPQLLGGQPRPALHRRAAGPARRAPTPAEAGRRAGPADAGRHRGGAAEAARGGGRVAGPPGRGGPARRVVAARLPSQST